MNAQTESDTRLRGRWLVLARAAWLALALLTWAVFLAALPARFQELRTVSATTERTTAQLMLPDLSITDASALAQLGLSVEFYAVYFVTLDVITMVAFFAIATVLFWRKSSERIAWLVSLTLVLDGGLLGGMIRGLQVADPLWSLATRFVTALGMSLSLIAVSIFPDGRFVPRWTRWPALLWVAVVVVSVLFSAWPLVLALAHWPPWLLTLFLVGTQGSALGGQIYRYTRVSGPVQRQQAKWVVFGVTAAIVARNLLHVPPLIIPAIGQPGLPWVLWSLLHEPVLVLFLMLIPLTLGISILRYRLWDIDLVINRTLVYGALTLSVVGLYVVIVGSLGAIFQTSGNLLISLLATALVAVLFQPLRERLQRGVNRLMYGERDDPVTVLSRLSKRLETTLAPNAVLPNVVETVAIALKLPYAAIALKPGDQFEIAAMYGQPVQNVIKLPLVYQTETVGELIVAPRAPGEGFSPADRQLLENIAHQVGAAAHAVRLTADLQRSREHLVSAREEERRRLRRDLHDGLGPALAAQTLKVGSARALLTRDPITADALLAQLEKDMETAVADIRRLVYNLRPPTLDELGLVAALRESAAQYRTRRVEGANHPNGLRISVDAPERLPHLPAAVEVAAYRIVQEALMNVVRHAHANTCSIRVALDDRLHLEVTDDGIGLPRTHRAGVGLNSMRERAEELGGTFSVERLANGGTRVCAELPLSQDVVIGRE